MSGNNTSGGAEGEEPTNEPFRVSVSDGYIHVDGNVTPYAVLYYSVIHMENTVLENPELTDTGWRYYFNPTSVISGQPFEVWVYADEYMNEQYGPYEVTYTA